MGINRGEAAVVFTIGALLVLSCAPVGAPGIGSDPGSIVFDSDRTGADEIFAMDANGSNVRHLTHVARTAVSSRTPGWSADRQWIVFTSNRNGPWADLYVMDEKGRNVRQLTSTPMVSEANPAWSPEGREVIYSAQARARAGEAGRDHEPAQLWIIDRNGLNARPVTHGSSRNIRPSWSPDGAAILFSSDRHAPLDPHFFGRDDGDLEIYRMQRNGSSIRRLTWYSRTALGAKWSPDGRQIVFQGYQSEEASDILTINVDGRGLRNLTRGRFSAGRPVWSPDGSKIAFNAKGSIYAMRADGSDVRMLSSGARHPDWR